MSQRQTRRNAANGQQMLEMVSDRGAGVTKLQREPTVAPDAREPTVPPQPVGELVTHTSADATAIGADSQTDSTTKTTAQKNKRALPASKNKAAVQAQAVVERDHGQEPSKRARQKRRKAADESNSEQQASAFSAATSSADVASVGEAAASAVQVDDTGIAPPGLSTSYAAGRLPVKPEAVEHSFPPPAPVRPPAPPPVPVRPLARPVPGPASLVPSTAAAVPASAVFPAPTIPFPAPAAPTAIVAPAPAAPAPTGLAAPAPAAPVSTAPIAPIAPIAPVPPAAATAIVVPVLAPVAAAPVPAVPVIAEPVVAAPVPAPPVVAAPVPAPPVPSAPVPAPPVVAAPVAAKPIASIAPAASTAIVAPALAAPAPTGFAAPAPAVPVAAAPVPVAAAPVPVPVHEPVHSPGSPGRSAPQPNALPQGLVPGPEPVEQHVRKTPLFLPGTPDTDGEGPDLALEPEPEPESEVKPALGEGNQGLVLDGKVFDLGEPADDPLLNKVIEAVVDNEFPQDQDGAPIGKSDNEKHKPGPFSRAEIDRIHTVAGEFFSKMQDIARETRRSVPAVLAEAKIAMKLSNKPTLYNLHTKRFCARMRADPSVGTLSLPELRARWNETYDKEVRCLPAEEKERLYEELLEWEAGEEKRLATRIKAEGMIYKVMLRIERDFNELATYYYNLYDVVVVGFVVSSRPGDADATRANCVFAPNKPILKLFENSDLREAMGELGALALTQRAAAVPVASYSKEEEAKVLGSHQQIVKDHTARIIRELQAKVRGEKKIRDKITWTNWPIELVDNNVCITGWVPKMALLDKGKSILNNIGHCRDFVRADFASHRGELEGDAILGIRPLTTAQIEYKSSAKTMSQWFQVPIWIGADGETRLTVGEALAQDRAHSGDNDDDAPADGKPPAKRKRGRGKKLAGEDAAAPPSKKRKVEPRERAVGTKRKKPSGSAPLPVSKPSGRPMQYEDDITDDEVIPLPSSSSSESEPSPEPEEQDEQDKPGKEPSKPGRSKDKERKVKQLGGGHGRPDDTLSPNDTGHNTSAQQRGASAPLPYQGSLQHAIAERSAVTVGNVSLGQANGSIPEGSVEPAPVAAPSTSTAPVGDVNMQMSDWFADAPGNAMPPFATTSAMPPPHLDGAADAFGALQLINQLQQPAAPLNSNGLSGIAGSGQGQIGNMLALLSQMPPQMVAQLQNMATQARGSSASQFPTPAAPSAQFFPQQGQMNGPFNFAPPPAQPAPPVQPNDTAVLWQLAQLMTNANAQNTQGGMNWQNGS